MQPTGTPPHGQADVRIGAASPEVEGGTRLQLTVDITSAAEPARSWLESSRSTGQDGRRT
ncbi:MULTISPECIES: hypothetical protein [Streptomyces]|uniref:Uncharacterized protein n=1 Tax=Streptomyces pseudovenezuelae TaxID=67350 RepID=A0A101N2T0_9ACTN|nr:MULTISPECIES: hypothetical protein [Streptomyces]KUM85502.1 hypothetical protein AQI94_26965 [Streptomyces pseudovenezuelae]